MVEYWGPHKYLYEMGLRVNKQKLSLLKIYFSKRLNCAVDKQVPKTIVLSITPREQIDNYFYCIILIFI